MIIKEEEKTTDHCEYCNYCVVDLDHHCPWSSKCIAGGNMPAFNCMLIGLLGCLLYLFGSLAYFMNN